MNLVGNTIILRAIERNDLPLLHQWSNDPEIWHWLVGWHFPYTQHSINQWWETLHTNKERFIFAIELKNKELVGTISLSDIDWKNRNAFHGLFVGNKTHRGQGIGFDALYTLMKFAFYELGLQRIDTDIIEYNESSLAFYTKKCGWHIEGQRKQWFYRQGQYWDKYLVGITRDQFNTFEQSLSKQN
ncbi:GNAT family N-acetyltransferase [Zooshikella harenae]|uniref:GNAT family N-acetyltransferase n=1 Tax=Zooshikella harenae TaxID=2827238 RepID=A0ABS5ZCW5_9GAMM|nr:GNAT family protein [Zooshikella harenae]MBU2711166.1 GNAT family N-acetyltransferase [Zooshikella harenae]